VVSISRWSSWFEDCFQKKETTMFVSSFMFRRRKQIQAQAQAQAVPTEEMPTSAPAKEVPVVGMGDGCSYKISKFWYDQVGPTNIDSICKVLSKGGATHLSALDDGEVLDVEFSAYVVYMDVAVRHSPIALALFSSLLRDQPKEGAMKCAKAWNRLLQHTRSDIATAAMRLGMLRRLAFTGLIDADDGALVQLCIDSREIRRVIASPEVALRAIADSVKHVVSMRKAPV
jgi:hypothetical protein